MKFKIGRYTYTIKINWNVVAETFVKGFTLGLGFTSAVAIISILYGWIS
jgi:hypothetical protein